MQEIVENLKCKGYRITKGRMTIIQIFFDNEEKHLSIEDVINEVKKIEGTVNVASVYNTLNILVKEGVIEQYNFQNKKLFELNKSIHGHFICKKCGKTININVPGLDCLDILIFKKYQAQVETNKIEFYGTCEECGKKENNN